MAGRRPGRASGRPEVRGAAFPHVLRQPHRDNGYVPALGGNRMDQPGSVAALLSQNGVQLVFNGHTHIYERNRKQPGESFVSYVTGGGGATLEPVGAEPAAAATTPTPSAGPDQAQGLRMRRGHPARVGQPGVPLPAGDRQQLDGNRGADRRDGTDVRRPDLLLLDRKADDDGRRFPGRFPKKEKSWPPKPARGPWAMPLSVI